MATSVPGGGDAGCKDLEAIQAQLHKVEPGMLRALMLVSKGHCRDLSHGPVAKNLPINAGHEFSPWAEGPTYPGATKPRCHNY